MTYHSINGLRYHYTREGFGDPVVLFHGFTGSSANWHGLTEILNPHYQVIAVDLPGHGRTDAPEVVSQYAMANVAADLVELIIRLNASPAHLLGYSMGGRLALYMAIQHPHVASALVLESASPGLAEAIERERRRDQDDALATRIEAEGVSEFVDYWESLPLFSTLNRLTPDSRDAIRAQRLANTAHGLSNSLRGMGTGVQPSLWDRLTELKVPVLQITGGLDEKFVAINRQMAKRIPTSQLEIVPNAGHTVHREQPDEYSRLVLEFLNRISDSDSQQLPGAEQNDEDQGGQRHLFEPGIQARQILRTADSQSIADQQRDGQQEQVLP